MQISTGFASWQRYRAALWASAKLCGVEQRAPPIFGKAAITLGTGPHSSSCGGPIAPSLLIAFTATHVCVPRVCDVRSTLAMETSQRWFTFCNQYQTLAGSDGIIADVRPTAAASEPYVRLYFTIALALRGLHRAHPRPWLIIIRPLGLITALNTPPRPLVYTVNHKKRDSIFLTITSANLNRFL